MVGIIYKITNKINGKSYIGQTVKPLNRRISEHLKDSKKDNLYFHRALKKYGFENFEVEIIEKDVAKENLNEREIYWIEFFHTYINDISCNGYNMTKGGELTETIRILSDLDINEIKESLKNSSELISELANKYNVSISTISDINTGRSWKDYGEIYPLRNRDIQELNYTIFLKVIDMLKTNLFSLNFICDKFNLSISTVSNINTGIYKKFKYPEDITFPIQSSKIVSDTKINTEDTLLLLIDYLNGFYKRKELAKKYNISEAYVKAIISSQNKNFLKDLEYPLKNFEEENLLKLNKKIEIINKFK